MAYTYTERKRIRKSFGSRESVLEIPYLLQMQKDAYPRSCKPGFPPRSAQTRAFRQRLKRRSLLFRTTVLWK